MHPQPQPEPFNMEPFWDCREKPYPTTQQTPKNVADSKSNRGQLQTYGNFKTATPTQRTNSKAPQENQRTNL
jgi:hypothetical protein